MKKVVFSIIITAIVFSLFTVYAQEQPLPAPPTLEELQKKLDTVNMNMANQQKTLDVLTGVSAYLVNQWYPSIQKDMAVVRDSITQDKEALTSITAEIAKFKAPPIKSEPKKEESKKK